MDWQEHRREAHALGRMQEFLKQIVYGGNDGIVTTFAIVAGFAGAQADGVAQIGGVAVLVFGLANLFADAVSMGLGEFLSTRSQHDLYRNRRASEMREIVSDPEHERMELFEILRQRGVPAGEADTLTTIVARHPELMADLMMTYEFGMLDPDEDSPALSGFMTFLSFVIFGSVPLIPYFLLDPTSETFWLSVAATGAALVALGVVRWSATGERLVRTVGETVLVGTVCALVAFGVGAIVGG
ncbi:VIT1/CCC1 transporter family protein [Roseovarius nanhaiticus]|uniref:Predicted Fe2+/Mn2+ transporter, VIT1/CCC1 family n=1 Tax=Roseovarius nanhaiticus TaxID=573024 RepID=A0A1N7HIW4_9RHOB|nr:VIT1/CCC1 transporter family protein [Roseovarius nanhaiticus]SEK92416.1 Predicted Fe2+/Mn2+ transporter, VIT1/CCC1 family [Roseovarius nanhaiticus]SIS24620.1 Predicted Fe2+/Mn2+ transporter, VIT1/CCC1 family [Roseovarius nanhaiticus]